MRHLRCCVSARTVRHMRASVAQMETRQYVRRVSDYDFIPGEEPDWASLSKDPWVKVSGGGLDAPIHIRLARTRDGAISINGLVMGASDGAPEVTANALRQIRPRDVVNRLFRTPPPEANEPVWGFSFERWPEIPSDAAAVRSSGTSDRLEEFAAIYLREKEIQPSRAMTATAEAMHISRATANRWAARARDRGLIPPTSAHD